MSWSDAGELHKELEARRIPIAGVCVAVDEPHSTQFAATFIPFGDRFVRIDWKSQPSREERDQAISVVQEGSPGSSDPERIVDSTTSEYPPDTPYESPDLSPCMGYYYPYIWVDGRPGAFQLELDRIHDLVHDTKITQEIRVKVFRLGFFVFDFSSCQSMTEEKDTQHEIDRLVKKKMRRVSIFNAHLVCLYNAMASMHNFCLDKMIICHEDVISMSNFEVPRYCEWVRSFCSVLRVASFFGIGCRLGACRLTL